MTREELAKELNISLRTLSNWEKEKPDLVRLVNQGLALDENIEATERHLRDLLAMKKKASSGKFQLK